MVGTSLKPCFGPQLSKARCVQRVLSKFEALAALAVSCVKFRANFEQISSPSFSWNFRASFMEDRGRGRHAAQPSNGHAGRLKSFLTRAQVLSAVAVMSFRVKKPCEAQELQGRCSYARVDVHAAGPTPGVRTRQEKKTVNKQLVRHNNATAVFINTRC
eukprot:6175706-Pleurochrysis_carterae.AAC.2